MSSAKKLLLKSKKNKGKYLDKRNLKKIKDKLKSKKESNEKILGKEENYKQIDIFKEKLLWEIQLKIILLIK